MSPDSDPATFDYRIGSSTLRIMYGDLAAVSADVLVASDDVDLMVDGGVALALARAGGDVIYDEARARRPVQLGDVVPTAAGELRAQRVFHAIVVDRNNFQRTTKDLIRTAVRRALNLADEERFRSIAFPALATGAGQFSAEASAMAMVVEFHRHLQGPTGLTSVVIVLYRTGADAANIAARFRTQVRQYVSILDEVVAVERELPVIAKQAARTRERLERDAVLTDPAISGERWATQDAFQELQSLREALESAGKDTARIRTVASSLKRRPLVISLHGIRTRGVWQKEITRPLNEAGFDHEPLDYGRFGLGRFVWPPARNAKVKWFRDRYFGLRKDLDRDPSVVAHSLGTYIVAKAIDTYDVRLDRVVFCGSIVPETYDWATIVKNGGVKQVLNDYGGIDFWVRMAPRIVHDAGWAGLSGFTETANGTVINRTHDRFRHSDYFYEGNYLNGWIPFLQGKQPSTPTNPKPPERNPLFRTTIVLVLTICLLTVLGLWLTLR